MIKKTLDNFDIAHTIFDDISLEYITRGTNRHDDHDMLVSIFNDHDVSYHSNEYLFHADNAVGQRLWQSVYDILPSDKPIVYVLYTNIYAPLQNKRAVQGIWAFKNQEQVSKFLPEMTEMLTWVDNSHLFKLPIKPNFTSKNWQQEFIDTYFITERHNYVENYLRKHHLQGKTKEQIELDQKLAVKHLSNEFLSSLAQKKSDIGHLIKANEYNTRVDNFLKKKHDSKNQKQLIPEARRLRHEYKSFFGGIETKADLSALNQLIGHSNDR